MDIIPWNKIADWLWYVETCIVPIRETGWRGTLIIDSTDYAQSPNAVLKYGHNMTSLDPLKNLMFSIHMYVDWREARKYNPKYSPYDKKMLAQIADMNIPVIIGEFGDRAPDSRRRVQLINARKVMRIADDNGIGYLGWSWKGNGIVNEVKLAPFLDISYDWTLANLTEWGKILVYDSRGLKNTSKIASIFDTRSNLNNTNIF